jgi:hypothetical protein
VPPVSVNIRNKNGNCKKKTMTTNIFKLEHKRTENKVMINNVKHKLTLHAELFMVGKDWYMEHKNSSLIFTVSMLTVQIINNHLKLSLYLTQYK